MGILPNRSGTTATRASTRTTIGSDEDAIPGEDTTEVSRLFSERLSAWKHCVAYLEDYVTATERLLHSQGKDYEKVLKTVSHPIKEGHHFDQSLGGIAGMFDNIRANTQGISNSHFESSKAIKGSILPIFERLHSEIKHKTKELAKGAGKASNAVEKARNATQRHIEFLGQHTASFDATGGKIAAGEDPYVIQRGVNHRLYRQIQEENANRQDLIAVQNSFAQFEAHVVKTMQTGLGQFHSVLAKQADTTKNLYGDIVGTAQRVPGDFEWRGFVQRNTHALIDPDAPPRTFSSVSFPNQGHRATVPVMAGSLDRRSTLIRMKYDTGYFVVTPSKYLHEFKTDDDFGSKDPTPELSLFLPDCVVGAVDGQKFVIKGKDAGKKLPVPSMTHEYVLRAHTNADAVKWWEVVRKAAGQVTDQAPGPSEPASPVVDSKKNGPSSEEKAGAAAGAGVGAGANSPKQESGQTSGTTAATPPPTATMATSTTAAEEKAAEAAAEKERAHAAEAAAEKERAHAAAASTATSPSITNGRENKASTGGPVATSAGPGEEVRTHEVKTSTSEPATAA